MRDHPPTERMLRSSPSIGGRSFGPFREPRQLPKPLASELAVDERRRIAEDLHRGPMQAVTVVGLQLQRLAHRAGDEQHKAIDEALHAVQDAAQQLRALIAGLEPPDLEDGLVVAVDYRLKDSLGSIGVAWVLRADLNSEPPLAVAGLAYQLIDEAITNLIRQAEVIRITVSLASEGDGFRVRIVSDGIGCAVVSQGDRGPGPTVEFWLPVGAPPD